MINSIKQKLYRIKRTVLKLYMECKVFLSLPVENKEYDFNSAKKYWQNVPKAKGSTPWNIDKINSIPDGDLLTQFKNEQKLARQKEERKIGFELAYQSIKNIDNPIVMDYGSGIGFNGFEILEKFPNASVVFIDINKINLDVIHRLAKLKGFSKRIETVEVKDPKAHNLHFAEKFDLILSMGVLHHTPYALDIVKRLTEYLKKGGIFKVMLYNKHYKKRLSLKNRRRLSESTFGELTDPVCNELKNPYSEAYDDDKAIKLFGNKYNLISKDYPTGDYNTYRFKKIR